MKIHVSIIGFVLVLVGSTAWAQRIPSIPIGSKGMTGSAGVGFVDFTTFSPSSSDVKFDRGTFITASIERPFNFLNLHLVLSIGHMSANGEANYQYEKNGTTYTANGLPFRATLLDVGLGLKMKAFESYWFRPYIGGGGLGGYHEISYTRTDQLAAQGSEYKSKDTLMGSGYYGEVGIEIEFTERFGVQLAGRLSEYSSKSLETLGGKKLGFRTETYYFSALIGF